MSQDDSTPFDSDEVSEIEFSQSLELFSVSYHCVRLVLSSLDEEQLAVPEQPKEEGWKNVDELDSTIPDAGIFVL